MAEINIKITVIIVELLFSDCYRSKNQEIKIRKYVIRVKICLGYRKNQFE